MRREVIICLALAAITLAVFWPVGSHDFINLDDPDYVTGNPVVQAGLTASGAHWAFEASHANNWHPLTWLSHMLDCQLFGLKPGAHHLSSLGFHLASTLLLFLALNQMTGALWRSALVAALFAWHPLHVESVAWIAERKDVLSAFFFMLTLWAYGRYAEGRRKNAECRMGKPAPRAAQHATRNTQHTTPLYLLSLGSFALGLMSKPMLVTLPLVLLLLDYWPLRRLSLPSLHHSSTPALRLFLEKAPFFALALAACVLTVHAQHAGGAVTSLEQLPWDSRLPNALAAYSVYLAKAFWPAHLAVFYPHVPVPAWHAALSVLLLLGVTALCFKVARSRPYLLVGWLWFCGMLVPVIGLVQVGWQAYADRYTYLPLIGVFLMAVWGVAELRPRVAGWNLALRFGSALLLGACLVATRYQLAAWQNATTLFSHALDVTDRNWLAHNNLGTALAEQGRVDEAGEHFRTAVQINSAYDDARSNLGRYLAESGKWDEAKAQLNALLQHSPNHVRAHGNLGYVLLAQGDIAQGVAQ
jgi:protein O-mannosyl-transferase